MADDSIEILCRHAAGARAGDVGEDARRALRVFFLDSLGVCIAGSAGTLCAPLMQAHVEQGPARILGTGARRAAGAAALINAYQVHNSEFDCIHDAAVVHPMAVVLGAALAAVDDRDVPVDGGEFMTAIAVGVDVGCRIGAASRAPMRFFRPATAGAFAATAAAGRLAGLDEVQLLGAMGITLGQLCGTMQAHTEGSPLLPLQAGFNARNAVLSCELARRGVTGPRQVLDGPYGYFALFEGEHDVRAAGTDIGEGLGSRWSICEVSHKPFPSGRATHGIVDACLELMREHGFAATDVAAVQAHVPPLTHRLVGRPVLPGMQSNYARLCGAYVAARALIGGHVGLEDFTAAALSDPHTLALAGRISVLSDGNSDPNALTPVQVTVRLHDGSALERRMDRVYGAPEKPMSRDAHLAKFRSNCAAGAVAVPPERVEAVIDAVDDLERCGDVARLLDLLEARA